ncbi:NAD(P)(+)--arginine ADP-ribosyltransferase 1-like [Sinocyclocheilus rhinocerous]|uniref:NAD(P)(+)--arginine ADP-ribosyltransferase 1-like n=1 Tax=Sinocyclocheilus rhinocerous TaxID=307959 RepID=UPI0007B83DE7|nr:PREDICTED: NAD(P)(+)--arginine ADP-ribosyltransferase 1-like [Sinocyclocheilus rhinocerous]
MLLIIEALLLSLAALGQDHRAAAARKIYPLDMALNSVDDQYKGCREKMSNHVRTNYLKKELNNSTDFRNAWKHAEKNVTRNWNIFRKLKKEHKIAIWVYTDPNSKIYVQFNNDTRNGKKNYTVMTYKWYSLYFLLTDAIQILKKQQNKCYYTYRGTNVKFNEHDFTGIRFGSFTSSSVFPGRAHSFGNVSCFEIRTCEGANITKYSRVPYEGEVLIPPYETFNVTAVKTKTDQKNLKCQTVFMLNSTGIKSDLNCALFKKPSKTISKYYDMHRPK